MGSKAELIMSFMSMSFIVSSGCNNTFTNGHNQNRQALIGYLTRDVDLDICSIEITHPNSKISGVNSFSPKLDIVTSAFAPTN